MSLFKRNRIIKGDCFEILKTLPAESIDLILTDPPYGMDYRSPRGRIHLDRDRSWFPLFASEAYRVLKRNSHLYCFCNDYSIGDFRAELARAGFRLKRSLVWVKSCHGQGDLLGDYGHRTEFILFAHKGRRELRPPREGNILSVPRIRGQVHPAEKPVSLLSYLIEKSSRPGDLVLDPFVGSGSTCLAAKVLGRDFLGIEIVPKFAAIGEERLRGSTVAKGRRQSSLTSATERGIDPDG